MTTTGPASPTTFTQYALSTSVGAWSDETLVGVNDDVTADSPYLTSAGDTSDVIRVSGFDFSAIPDGSTIDDIAIAVRCYKISGTSSATVNVTTGSGISFGDENDWLTTQDNGGFAPGALDYVTVRASDLGPLSGHAYTAAEIKSPDFFVDLYASRKAAGNGADVGIDHVEVTITSTDPGGATYTLTATPGSYAVTGTAANLRAARRLSATPGSYAITGTAAALKIGHRLTASPGSYSLTGTSLTLTKALKITASGGSYSLSGTAATFHKGWSLSAAVGSYAVTGTAVSFPKTLSMAASVGSYGLTGTAASFRRALGMAVAVGSYSLAGTAVAFKSGHTLTASVGSYVLTGTSATLSKTKPIVATPGSYAITGTAVTFHKTLKLTASPGSYTLSFTTILASVTRQIRLFQPANAPPWLPLLTRSIERELYNASIPEVTDVADLPPAEDYRSWVYHVVGLHALAISDGSVWRRINFGLEL